MGDLTEEEKIKLRRSFNERMAQKNVMMASAAILWLSLVKDPEGMTGTWPMRSSK